MLMGLSSLNVLKVITPQELFDDVEYGEILEDMKEEGQKFGNCSFSFINISFFSLSFFVLLFVLYVSICLPCSCIKCFYLKKVIEQETLSD